MKLIFNVYFKTKHPQGNEFTIIAEVASLNKEQALIDGVEHVKKHYSDVVDFRHEKTAFVETMQARITQLKRWGCD
jgi:hypothetical protein